jgi:hypothetical protein
MTKVSIDLRSGMPALLNIAQSTRPENEMAMLIEDGDSGCNTLQIRQASARATDHDGSTVCLLRTIIHPMRATAWCRCSPDVSTPAIYGN